MKYINCSNRSAFFVLWNTGLGGSEILGREGGMRRISFDEAGDTGQVRERKGSVRV